MFSATFGIASESHSEWSCGSVINPADVPAEGTEGVARQSVCDEELLRQTAIAGTAFLVGVILLAFGGTRLRNSHSKEVLLA